MIKTFSVAFADNFSTLSSNNPPPGIFPECLWDEQKPIEQQIFPGKAFPQSGLGNSSSLEAGRLCKVYTDLGQLEHTTFQRSSRSTGFTGLDFLTTEAARSHEESLYRGTAIVRHRHPR